MVKQKRTITAWTWIHRLCSEAHTHTHHDVMSSKTAVLSLTRQFWVEISETWNESTERQTNRLAEGNEKNNISLSQSKHAINRKHLTQHNSNKKEAFFDSTICALNEREYKRASLNINTHMMCTWSAPKEQCKLKRSYSYGKLL